MWNTFTNDRLDQLSDRIRSAGSVTDELWSAVTADAGARAVAGRLARMATASAWTDAALTLLEAGLPHWSVRRLVREDGEWTCSLSRRPALPLELDDDVVEERHEDLGLAILAAMVEARRSDLQETAWPGGPLEPSYEAGTILDTDDYA